MDVIKKQFKDFWAYYRLTSYGGDSKENVKTYFPAMMVVFIAMFATMLQLQCEIYGFAVALYLIAISTGEMTANRRTLLAVAPFSPKQKVIFTYLSMLFTFVLFVVIINAAYCVIMLIVALITFCVSGENILATEFYGHVSASSTGIVITIFLCLITFLVTFSLTYIEKNKTRNIAAAVYLAVSEFIALALANVCGRATAEEGTHKFYFSENVITTVDSVKNSWIILVVLGVFTAAMFAVSLWLVIKRNKSSNV